ncbi:MAG: type IV pilus twitching motility protein PilT [Kiritimatiellae bacterium]|nr:type IV pilus twitching motility protein PilT [Kiritimatiellia bacterium]
MKYEMLEMLQLCVDEGASDLHLRVDAAPMLRIHGALTPIDGDPLDEEDTLELAKVITTEEQFAEVNERGGCDFAYAFEDQARFRVSVFKERGRFGLALRLIPNALLTLQQIGLPEQVRELLFKPRGLVLVTGPTGSGKSTTLASMLNIINEQRDCHIITVEDPIEYYHANKKSLVTQREIGNDVPSFSESIRRALRQDPDVILIGEMRDLETMQAAITAAETGHLVFATLHTTGAATTVDRIVDAFPTEQQPQVRTQLSVSISAIISQLLLKRIDKPGRVAAFEIMIATPSIRSRIRDNKTFMIDSDIQTGAKFGMISLDTHLMNLYTAGIISYEDLITMSRDPDTVVQKLKELGLSRQ